MRACLTIHRIVYAISMLALLVTCGAAQATDRYYRDQTVFSSNGRYKLDAKSPHNAGEHPRPFARDFVYSLYDTRTGDLVWQRAQPRNESSPVSIYLHDDAWTTIRTGSDELIVLEPVTAQVVVSISILDEFTQQENEAHVSWTTAGPMWTAFSHWYYLERGDELYFVVRPAWQNRVILDITGRRLCPRNDPALLPDCLLAENRSALGALKEGTENIAAVESQEAWDRAYRAQTAAIIAAQNGERAAIPFLSARQHCNDFGSSSVVLDFNAGASSDEINPFSWSSRTLRRIVQDALRILGERPEELPCTFFRLAGADYSDPYISLPPLPAPRATRVDLVQEGASAMQVLQAVGPPDDVIHYQRAWEYSMDADEPYTLRLIFSDEHRVAVIERLTPPLWHKPDEWVSRLGW